MTNWCESLPSPPSRQPPTSLSPSLSTMTSLSHQPSSSPSIMTSSYTKMTYLLKVEHDSSKVLPTDFLTDSKYITRQITERMLIKMIYWEYTLGILIYILFEYVSINENISVENTCVPVRFNTCTTVEIVILLQHDVTLAPGLVVYQFLRHKDKLKINRNDYSFNCIGKQAIDAEYNIILEGCSCKSDE
mmetsp:Transcript_56538/g.84033  ORF Transcript_56538/g.84033 Transcript_56538/m.84033 type:complete len:189 (+) Transcript_56538:124-690(+)